jgi:hypothetical protein
MYCQVLKILKSCPNKRLELYYKLLKILKSCQNRTTVGKCCQGWTLYLYRVFQKKVPTLFFGIFQLQRHLWYKLRDFLTCPMHANNENILSCNPIWKERLDLNKNFKTNHLYSQISFIKWKFSKKSIF